MYGLLFILQVFVDDDLFAVVVQGLKSDRGLSCEGFAVEREGDDDASVCLFRDKFGSAGHFFAVRDQRLAGRFIHQPALYGVLFAGDEVLVEELVPDGDFFIRVRNVAVRL